MPNTTLITKTKEQVVDEHIINEHIINEHIINEYINQLSQREKTVLEIARQHLETSFSLEKSIGFKQWYEVAHGKK
jgi:hypothetical protein